MWGGPLKLKLIFCLKYKKHKYDTFGTLLMRRSVLIQVPSEIPWIEYTCASWVHCWIKGSQSWVYTKLLSSYLHLKYSSPPPCRGVLQIWSSPQENFKFKVPLTSKKSFPLHLWLCLNYPHSLLNMN